MNPELDTLDTLSARFEAFVDALPRAKMGGWNVVLAEGDPLPPQGEQILAMYEALYEQVPDDAAVRSALAQHLFRLGSLYDRAVDPALLSGMSERGSGAGDATRTAGYAQQACRCLVRSYRLLPGPYAALALADLFRGAGFCGTALAWYAAAERAQGDRQTREEATRQRQRLQAQGRTADPPLSAGRLFPTRDTPGLAPAARSGTAGNAAGSRSAAGGSGRYAAYGAAALLVLLACLGGGWWLRNRAAYASSRQAASAPLSASAHGRAARRNGAVGNGPASASGLRASPVPLRDKETWTVRASSTRNSVPDRADAHTITYAPRNAVDADATTAWSPGRNLANDGIGEWLEVDFPSPRRIARLGMIAGYPKQHPFYGDVFWLNNRVKEARLTFSDGSTMSWSLHDRKPMQLLTLPAPVSTSSVRFAIQSVYRSAPHKGGRARWHDTSIAEVAFWGAR